MPWILDTQKGPMVWETKHLQLVPKGEDGLPAAPLHLIVARIVRDVLEVKFFVSNAPPETALAELLHVAFSRWRIERCFEDQKTELGFDHFEGRSYLGLKRHQAIPQPAICFCPRFSNNCGGKNAELTVCQARTAMSALVRSWGLGRTAARLILDAAAAEIGYTQRRNALARRSHTRTTRKKLAALGIRLKGLPRCGWSKR